MISTYFGSMTIVLKFPLTSAASTNGLQRYKGFWVPATGADGDAGGRWSAKVALGDVVEVGVGDRLGPLGPERCIERLYMKMIEKYMSVAKPSRMTTTTMTKYRVPYGVEKRHHLSLDSLRDWTQYERYRIMGLFDCRTWALLRRKRNRLARESPWRLLHHVFIGFRSRLAEH